MPLPGWGEEQRSHLWRRRSGHMAGFPLLYVCAFVFQAVPYVHKHFTGVPGAIRVSAASLLCVPRPFFWLCLFPSKLMALCSLYPLAKKQQNLLTVTDVAPQMMTPTETTWKWAWGRSHISYFRSIAWLYLSAWLPLMQPSYLQALVQVHIWNIGQPWKRVGARLCEERHTSSE